MRRREGVHGAEVGSLDRRGIKWKEHIYEEHNFKEMLLYIIYLLNLSPTRATASELRLKDKIQNADVSFFDDLRIDRKLNRLAITSDKSLRLRG